MKALFLLFSLLLALQSNSQIINIPDANFKNALVNTNCVIDISETNPPSDADTNNDGEIQLSEAVAIISLDVNSQNIVSMAGIENFTGLWALNCSYNQLSTLDLTPLSNLLYVDCSHNQLTTLSVVLLTSSDWGTGVDCSFNLLTDFTVPAGGIEYTVDCSNNQLSNLVIPTGTNLYSLTVDNNPFISLDISAINHIHVNNCPLLTSCTLNADTVTLGNNPQLVSAVLGSRGIYEVHNNLLLESINLKDGVVDFINAGDMYNADFNFQGNPSLQFVCVDDAGHWYDEGGDVFFLSEANQVDVDPGVNIIYYCDFLGGGFNTVNGTLHYDCAGSNSVINNPTLSVSLDQGSNGSVQAITNPNGSGNFYFYTNGSGTITPNIPNSYFTVTPASYTYSFSGSGGTENVDFCISPNGSHSDLQVTLMPVISARPGFDATYRMQIENNGTGIQFGIVSLSFEDAVSDFVSANPAVDGQSANLLSWNFVNLAPLEIRQFDITLNINSPLETPPVNIGDILNFTATITGAADETPDDNTFDLLQIVVGSFDPNDKSVSKTNISVSELSEYLYYTVRFQNTGTYFAENVAIRDLLSDNLDLSTFEVVASSHPCRALLTPQNNSIAGNRLELLHEGINLPAESDDEPGSHGFVAYRIKPKAALTVGDIIENTAEIYFDYNSAITTNTVSTTVTALGISDFSFENTFSMYPNPAEQSITVSSNGNLQIEEVSIYNMLGQCIKTIDENVGTISIIDIKELKSGTYIVEIKSGNENVTKQLIKL